jgi:hypothetical protein
MAKRLETFSLPVAMKALRVSALQCSATEGGFLQRPSKSSHAQRRSVRGRTRKARPAVYLCFVDIRRAYDSVVHMALCSGSAEPRRASVGRFLTSLQARYQNAKAVLNLDE